MRRLGTLDLVNIALALGLLGLLVWNGWFRTSGPVAAPEVSETPRILTPARPARPSRRVERRLAPAPPDWEAGGRTAGAPRLLLDEQGQPFQD